MTLSEREVVSFAVRGDPEPQPRPRAFRSRIYNPDTADRWKAAVAAASQLAWREEPLPLPRPLEVAVTVFVARPQRLLTRNSDPGLIPLIARGAGDGDNFAKAILDAMEGIIFVNDCQVARLTIEKYYVAIGYKPGARVWVLDWAPLTLFAAAAAAEEVGG